MFEARLRCGSEVLIGCLRIVEGLQGSFDRVFEDLCGVLQEVLIGCLRIGLKCSGKF